MADQSCCSAGVRSTPQNTVRNGPAKLEVVQSIHLSAVARVFKSAGYHAVSLACRAIR
ncbi:hypothetical protein D3C85_1695580 [compost metagenome]